MYMTKSWASIDGHGTLLYHIWKTNINQETYVQMLKDKFKQVSMRYRYYQQDGASVHFAKSVRSYLDEWMPNRWIGRGSPFLPWPAKSPDLNPCDFYLWGRIYGLLSSNRPSSKDELIHALEDLSKELNASEVSRACMATNDRCNEVIQNEGKRIKAR